MGGPPGFGRGPSRTGALADRRLSTTTVRAVVQYDGTNFSGMQVQPHARTVAGELQRALSKLLREPVSVTAAGRTDAGVHASGQVVSFRTNAAFPFERLAVAANALLPHDVSVLTACTASDQFSARSSALERSYVYAIFSGAQRSAMFSRFAWHVWRPLDLARFEAGAAHLVGEHDFRSFCAQLPQNGPTIRTVRSLNVARFGDLLRVEIRADGFLHRMVRTIVGTLLECAQARRAPESIPAILHARDRTAAGRTAPPHGLFLAGVRYTDGFDSFVEPPIFCSGCTVKS